MKEGNGNADSAIKLSAEPDLHQELSSGSEVPINQPASNEKLSMFERILRHSTARHITFTSGPNSR